MVHITNLTLTGGRDFGVIYNREQLTVTGITILYDDSPSTIQGRTCDAPFARISNNRVAPFARISNNRVDIGAFQAVSGVRVNLSSSGPANTTVNVTREGEDVVIQAGDPELFRGPATTLGSLRLDLSGGGKNVLRLDPAKVLAISPVEETVTVIADRDDVIELEGGWKLSGTEIENGRVVKILAINPTLRLIGPNDWRNPIDPLDVDADGVTAPIDALIVINELNDPHFSAQNRQLADPANLSVFPRKFYDVNGDGFVAPIDALQIFNFLNGVHGAEGEGGSAEGEGGSAMGGPTAAWTILGATMNSSRRWLCSSLGRSMT